jgi:hypothetical protein
MAREISLDGGEITLLKKIGLSGRQAYGKVLVDQLETGEIAPFLETLISLVDQGYVLTNKVNIRAIEDVETAFFRVNPASATTLRDAVNPSRTRERERTQRRRPRRR